MIKREELSNPQSCMSKAKDDEMVFVLLGRDVSSPAAIHAWVEDRIAKGKNEPGDKQIADALECAVKMAEGRVEEQEVLYTDFVSDEPLETIRNNECESQVGSLATDRFRKLWNAYAQATRELRIVKQSNWANRRRADAAEGKVARMK